VWSGCGNRWASRSAPCTHLRTATSGAPTPGQKHMQCL
jgi:hypothetical protein